MNTTNGLEKMANLPKILAAAQVLEHYGLLLHGEKATEVVKRYIEAHPDINKVLSMGSNDKA